MRRVEYRDVRPDGTVLTHWTCPEGQETPYVYPPGFYPEPPWDRQRRPEGGEWATFATVRDGEVRWFTEAAFMEEGP